MEEFWNYLVIIINRIDECLLLGRREVGGKGEGKRSLNVDTLSLWVNVCPFTGMQSVDGNNDGGDFRRSFLDV